MKTLTRILSLTLVAISLSAAVATAQQADKNVATKPLKTELPRQTPPPQGGQQAREAAPAPERPAPPPPAEKEEKRWGLQVTTGEKWYQVSIKLVM